MKVLLLVDVQNDFCPGGALAVPDGDKIVPIINALIANGGYDAIIATKDWHPAEHKSFAVNHEGGAVYAVTTLNGLPQVLWPAHCVQGSPGAEFHPGLNAAAIDEVVLKGTDPDVDSYSGFFDNARRHETELKQLLMGLAFENEIRPGDVTIDVCGLATDYCVKATALDATSLGFSCRVVLDACRAVNLQPGDDLAALREMTGKHIDVVESPEVLSARIIAVPLTSRPNDRRSELQP